MIEICDLSKSFGEIAVLHDVNLSIKSGETAAIIGPSGSGKSTLLRCINMLEIPTKGHIIIDGISSEDKKKYAQIIPQKVGMVFQQFNLFPHKNVIENLILAPRMLKKGTKEVLEEQAIALLRRVGLENKKSAYPETLSGGQKQRVAIARALMMKPEILLFDEPTSSLDPEMVSEVLDVMRDLQKEGLTMVLVSHEMKFVRECSQHVIFMDQGRIIEQNHPDVFFNHSQQERTVDFLSKIL